MSTPRILTCLTVLALVVAAFASNYRLHSRERPSDTEVNSPSPVRHVFLEAWHQDDEPTVDFQRQIRPLLSDRCFKCHGPDEGRREAGLRLDRREDAMSELGAGVAVIRPGSLDESELHWRITSDDPDEQMPPPGSNLSLSAAEIELIERWIEQGANWEEHWSFGALDPADPPSFESEDWVRNEIDRYVLWRLRDVGLEPSDRASRERLIRRLTFDLTGLPPTLDEIDAFLADDSDNAYESLVDRLLASEAYGERMTADWLDVARYSDSYGFQVDRDRHVWPWRDWVIQSFNSNMPYDDFMTWQVAGDLLPNATDQQILATTFCRLHSQKVEGGSVPEEFRTEYVADRTHTFAMAFLGLTFECARCHDHKYDPITQKEYYELFAYFNNIDEAGLYSYFTSSVPTPTLPLMNESKRQQLSELESMVRHADQGLQEVVESSDARFAAWLQETMEGSASLEFPAPLTHLSFEDSVSAPNQTVEGVVGNAVQLTGDDGIDVGVGNFNRSQSFSIELWVKVPVEFERAVIFHRSRAWTDAASRGYELLLLDGKLSWSLIHFWPGNAIGIQAIDPIELDTWTHVVVTYDGSSTADGLDIYVDGQNVATDIVRDSLTKNITGGGGDTITIGERFRDRGLRHGMVDELKVYDRRITEWEARHQHRGLSDIDPDEMKVASSRDEGSEVHARLLREWYQEVVDAEIQSRRENLAAARLGLNKELDGLTEIMVMREMETRRETHVLHRGSYASPRDVVLPATPSALPPLPDDARLDRLGLAEWLTGPAHPLAARVAVNHYWQLIFGAGLVRTPEDFGSQGSPPSHPELLDWLARDFVEHDWNVKRLLKLIVMSSTYQQDSTTTPERRALDVENIYLSRGARYRLPAEMIRDQALYLSGLMVDKIGGPPARPYELTESFKPMNRDDGEGLYRRSVYTFWKRTGPAPVMMALDASKRDVCVVKRERTATPLQSLVLMNDPQFVEAARHLAQGLLHKHESDDEAIAVELFRILTSRHPDAFEVDVILRMFVQQRDHFALSDSQAVEYLEVGVSPRDEALDVNRFAAWSLVALTLMNFDECTTKR